MYNYRPTTNMTKQNKPKENDNLSYREQENSLKNAVRTHA